MGKEYEQEVLSLESQNRQLDRAKFARLHKTMFREKQAVPRPGAGGLISDIDEMSAGLGQVVSGAAWVPEEPSYRSLRTRAKLLAGLARKLHTPRFW